MRVLVCGGRDYKDRANVYRWLTTMFEPAYPNDVNGTAGTWLPRPDLHLIVGGAKGADQFAEDWAVVHWVQYSVYTADWNKHGKAAGYIRNRQMLEEGKPDLVIAFPGGNGTADMVAQARAAKVPVLEIPT